MKEDIMIDLSILLSITRDCKQYFFYWAYYVSNDTELSMHFNKQAIGNFRFLIMEMHKTLNTSQSDKCTFWKIFTRLEAREYEENAITLEKIIKWRAILANHAITIDKIKVLRDTQIVHTDKGAPIAELVSMCELKKLLLVMECIVKEMFNILGNPIASIAIIEDHSIAEAFKRLEINMQYKQLLKKMEDIRFSDPV